MLATADFELSEHNRSVSRDAGATKDGFCLGSVILFVAAGAATPVAAISAD